MAAPEEPEIGGNDNPTNLILFFHIRDITLT